MPTSSQSTSKDASRLAFSEKFKSRAEKRNDVPPDTKLCWVCLEANGVAPFEDHLVCLNCGTELMMYFLLPFSRKCLFTHDSDSAIAVLKMHELDNLQYQASRNTFTRDSEWVCWLCGHTNEADETACVECQSAKPKEPICPVCDADFTATPECRITGALHETWTCKKCKDVNLSSQLQCRVCNYAHLPWYCAKCGLENLPEDFECCVCHGSEKLSSHKAFEEREYLSSLGFDESLQKTQLEDAEEADRGNLYLKTRMEKAGLQAIPMADDGNCQFRAIAYQLVRSAEFYPVVRHIITEVIANRPERFKPLVGEDEFDGYVREMRQDKFWGDEVTLVAASEAFKVFVHVIKSDKTRWYLKYSPFDSEKNIWKRHVFLAYRSPNHYYCMSSYHDPGQLVLTWKDIAMFKPKHSGGSRAKSAVQPGRGLSPDQSDNLIPQKAAESVGSAERPHSVARNIGDAASANVRSGSRNGLSSGNSGASNDKRTSYRPPSSSGRVNGRASVRRETRDHSQPPLKEMQSERKSMRVSEARHNNGSNAPSGSALRVEPGENQHNTTQHPFPTSPLLHHGDDAQIRTSFSNIGGRKPSAAQRKDSAAQRANSSRGRQAGDGSSSPSPRNGKASSKHSTPRVKLDPAAKDDARAGALDRRSNPPSSKQVNPELEQNPSMPSRPPVMAASSLSSSPAKGVVRVVNQADQIPHNSPSADTNSQSDGAAPASHRTESDVCGGLSAQYSSDKFSNGKSQRLSPTKRRDSHGSFRGAPAPAPTAQGPQRTESRKSLNRRISWSQRGEAPQDRRSSANPEGKESRTLRSGSSSHAVRSNGPVLEQISGRSVPSSEFHRTSVASPSHREQNAPPRTVLNSDVPSPRRVPQNAASIARKSVYTPAGGAGRYGEDGDATHNSPLRRNQVGTPKQADTTRSLRDDGIPESLIRSSSIYVDDPVTVQLMSSKGVYCGLRGHTVVETNKSNGCYFYLYSLATKDVIQSGPHNRLWGSLYDSVKNEERLVSHKRAPSFQPMFFLQEMSTGKFLAVDIYGRAIRNGTGKLTTRLHLVDPIRDTGFSACVLQMDRKSPSFTSLILRFIIPSAPCPFLWGINSDGEIVTTDRSEAETFFSIRQVPSGVANEKLCAHCQRQVSRGYPSSPPFIADNISDGGKSTLKGTLCDHKVMVAEILQYIRS